VARRLWARPAPDPTVDPAAASDPVDRSRIARIILWLKVAAAVIEIAAGIALLILGILNFNIGTWVRHWGLRELQGDPGDFVARHLLAAFPALTRTHEVVDGAVVAAYGVLKGGVVVAVLRHHHRVAIFGAFLFTLVAFGAAFALLLHLTTLRVVLGALDVAVAFVMVREALSLRRHAR
jgi:uncharacterized membrane protein